MVRTRSSNYTAVISPINRPAARFAIKSPQPGGRALNLSYEPNTIQKVVVFIDTQYRDLLAKYNIEPPRAWLKENVVIDKNELRNFVKTFNKAVDSHRNKRVPLRLQLQSILKWSDPILSLPMEEEIFEACYGLSVADPKELNAYKPFSSEVYGETKTVQMRSILDEIHVGPDDIFIDLGSGIGQFTCFASAHSKVKKSYGIELAKTPADVAIKHKAWFKKIMMFLGRTYTDIDLRRGSIKDLAYRQIICQEATVIYVNNFTFDQELKQDVKEILTACKDGVKIISTAPLVLPTVRKSKFQTAKDALAVISSSRLLTGIVGGVSWTAKEAELTLTTIQR